MSKRGEAIRKLSKAFPAPAELKEAIAALHKQPDRIAAIVGGAIVEGVLERLILSRLEIKSKDRIDALFTQNGPLSTFSGKILIAGAFGLVSEPMADELTRLKNIRNVFAHATTNVTFSTPEIANFAHEFRMLEAMREVGEKGALSIAERVGDVFTGQRGYVLIATILCIMMDEEIKRRGGDRVYGGSDA